MKMKVDYFDNFVKFDSSKVIAVEIKNKKYFFRFISDLWMISNGDAIDTITFYDDNNNIILYNGKVSVIFDYVNLSFNSKKISSLIGKYVCSLFNENDKISINSCYKKLIFNYKKVLNNADLPLAINEEFDIDNMIKLLKVNICPQKELIDNLMLFLDVHKNLKLGEMIIFVNLKQYLSNSELQELYKYAIYNNFKIMLVDSQCYKELQKYESKLIVDENFDEFVL